MSLEILDAEHLGPLRQGLANVLSTPTADLTYAQIVDGMPLASIYAEDHWFREGLPVMDHEELCPGVLEKTRALRSEFDVSSLPFQPQVNLTLLRCKGSKLIHVFAKFWDPRLFRHIRTRGLAPLHGNSDS